MNATMTTLPKRLNFTALVAEAMKPSSVHYYCTACTINVNFFLIACRFSPPTYVRLLHSNKPTEEAPSLCLILLLCDVGCNDQ
jgi:hypothetical protein